VLTKDGIRTLAKVVLADPTQAYLFPRCCATQGFTAPNAIQAKERSYHDQHPINQLFPSTMTYLDAYITKTMCFYIIVLMSFGV
jgi:hypothetical protein